VRWGISSHGAEFVPMAGPEQEIVDLMHDYLVPVAGPDEDTPVVTGQEQCAAAIVKLLEEKGYRL
jgi:hypothetical protein